VSIGFARHGPLHKEIESRGTGARAISSSACVPAIPAGWLPAVASEGAVERVLGAVAHVTRERTDGVGRVLEPLCGDVHPPAGEVGERRLSDPLCEATGEGCSIVRSVSFIRSRANRETTSSSATASAEVKPKVRVKAVSSATLVKSSAISSFA
jgi:hypothetical protein